MLAVNETQFASLEKKATDALEVAAQAHEAREAQAARQVTAGKVGVLHGETFIYP